MLLRARERDKRCLDAVLTHSVLSGGPESVQCMPGLFCGFVQMADAHTSPRIPHNPQRRVSMPVSHSNAFANSDAGSAGSSGSQHRGDSSRPSSTKSSSGAPSPSLPRANPTGMIQSVCCRAGSLALSQREREWRTKEGVSICLRVSSHRSFSSFIFMGVVACV